MIKQKRGKKELWFLILILLIVNLSLINADSTNFDDYLNEDKKYEDFKDESIKDKNKGWRDYSALKKETFVLEMLEDIGQRRQNQNLDRAVAQRLGQNFLDSFLESANDAGISDISGISLDTLRESGGSDVVLSLLDNMGVNKNILLDNTQIKDLKGFNNPNLQWSEDYLIGDGKTWLDLGNLPPGVEVIEYKEEKFILNFKDGRKLVLGEGSTDENGNLKFLSQNTNEKGIVNMGGKVIGSSGLRNLVVKGDVTITEDGFKLGKGGRVEYGRLIFEKNTNGEGSVVFGKNNLVLKGLEFEFKGYGKVPETSKKFTVNFGRFENLAREISFEDRKITSVSRSGHMGMGTYQEEVETSAGRVYFKFENGKVTHVRKDKVNKGNWIPVTLSLKGDSFLEDIYSSSGETVRSLLQQANEGVSLDFKTVEEKFYDDSLLTKNAREIKIDSYAENFLSINGENFVVGGDGEIEVLRDLNSLNGHECKNFDVKVGDVRIGFSEKGVEFPREQVEGSFEIRELVHYFNGELSKSFTLDKTKSGGLLVSESDKVVAGRKTLLGPFGVSVDVEADVPKDDVEKIRKKLDEAGWSDYSKDIFVDAMSQTEYELNVGAYIPVEGLQVRGLKIKEAYEKYLVDKTLSFLAQQEIDTGDEQFGVQTLKPETQTIFKGIAESLLNSLSKVNAIKTKGVFVSIKNNPNGNPSLTIQLQDGSAVPVTLNNEQGKFIRDAMKISLIAPESSRGDIDRFTLYGGLVDENMAAWKLGKNKISQKYWPQSYIKRLWNYNLGRGENNWDRMMSQRDVKIIGDFFNKYFKRKGDSEFKDESILQDTSRTYY